MLRKTLIASALSSALAVTSFATPAAAAPDGQDYARVLLGIVTLGALANAISDNNKNRNAGHHQDYRHDDRYRQGDRRGSRNWNLLPSRCEYTVRGRNGRTNVFGESCLRREGVRVNSLPRQCEFRIRTNDGRPTVFASQCLENHGYTSEARWQPRRR